MRHSPPIASDEIIATLHAKYGLESCELEFLAVGMENSSWAFRARSMETDWFIKVRSAADTTNGAMRAVRALSDGGLPAITAPCRSLSGSLCQSIGDAFALLVFPWVKEPEEHRAEKHQRPLRRLSPSQAHELGRVMRQLHEGTSLIPQDVRHMLPVETFRLSARRSAVLTEVQRLLGEGAEDPELCAFLDLWRVHRQPIDKVIERYRALSARLSRRSWYLHQPERHVRSERTTSADESPAATKETRSHGRLVPSHGDLHSENVLRAADGEIRIVDWDGLAFAPRERDLMFQLHDQDFLDGYSGSACTSDGFSFDRSTPRKPGAPIVHVDGTVLSFYRHDWVVQEFTDFAERVIPGTDYAEPERAEAVEEFSALFKSGGVVDAALAERQPSS